MTDGDSAQVQSVIAKAQRLHNSLHDKLAEAGVQPIDALIASLYATHNLGSRVHGNPVAAIEWMRDAVDTIERQVLEAMH
jgi:hypothetical protein